MMPDHLQSVVVYILFYYYSFIINQFIAAKATKEITVAYLHAFRYIKEV